MGPVACNNYGNWSCSNLELVLSKQQNINCSNDGTKCTYAWVYHKKSICISWILVQVYVFVADVACVFQIRDDITLLMGFSSIYNENLIANTQLYILSYFI